MNQKIKIEGARVHNLKNIDLEIPRNSLVVITGLSGSGPAYGFGHEHRRLRPGAAFGHWSQC